MPTPDPSREREGRVGIGEFVEAIDRDQAAALRGTLRGAVAEFAAIGAIIVDRLARGGGPAPAAGDHLDFTRGLGPRRAGSGRDR